MSSAALARWPLHYVQDGERLEGRSQTDEAEWREHQTQYALPPGQPRLLTQLAGRRGCASRVARWPPLQFASAASRANDRRAYSNWLEVIIDSSMEGEKQSTRRSLLLST